MGFTPTGSQEIFDVLGFQLFRRTPGPCHAAASSRLPRNKATTHAPRTEQPIVLVLLLASGWPLSSLRLRALFVVHCAVGREERAVASCVVALHANTNGTQNPRPRRVDEATSFRIRQRRGAERKVSLHLFIYALTSNGSYDEQRTVIPTHKSSLSLRCCLQTAAHRGSSRKRPTRWRHIRSA